MRSYYNIRQPFSSFSRLSSTLITNAIFVSLRVSKPAANMSEIPKLPLELIFHIIANLLGDPRAILPPSHAATKTLLSLTLVCRATYPIASNYLRQHCAYIDNDRRLRELIHCIESTRDWTQGTASALSSLPPYASLLRPITSLYLAPFGASLDDQPTAIWTRELFCLLGPHLTRLVADLPLRTLYPADDHLDVRRTLRAAFGELAPRLEELVSVRDELYLDVLEPGWPRAGGGEEGAAEPRVWTAWPRLRRLALYNVDAGDAGFWADVRRMPRLGAVVLTRADGLRGVGLKSAYFGAGAGAAAGAPRPLKVMLVNVSNDHPDGLREQESWDTVDPGNVVDARSYDVPTSFYGDEDVGTLCQEWVKSAALRGDLWDWEGTPLRARQGGGGANGAQLFELEA